MKITFSFLILFALTGLSTSQTNTWQTLNENQTGARQNGALVYVPDSNRFILTLGTFPDSTSYSDLMYSDAVGKWINFFPADTLFGIWGDSTGKTRGLGRSGPSVFTQYTYYFGFQNISYSGVNYLRPNLRSNSAFRQYAWDSDSGKIRYYVGNRTFAYHPGKRRWDTTLTTVHPAAVEGGTDELRWGALCYDPVNHEVLLMGSGGVDAKNGHAGCWTYKPATRTWTKLNGAVEPGPRTHTAMVYDTQNRKIVLFGGDHLDYLTNETWVYDCATRTWERKTPAIAPSPRAGHAMLYLPKSRTVILYGGFVYTSTTSYCAPVYAQKSPCEMWKYDVMANTWTLIKSFSASDSIPALQAPASIMAAVDTSDRIMIIASANSYGTLIRERTAVMTCNASLPDASGTTTLGVSPNTQTYRTAPYDPAWFNLSVAAPDTAANEAFLRNIPSNQWTNVAAPKRPGSNRDWGTTILDPDRDVMLKFSGGHSAHCGNDVPHYSLTNNRWTAGYFPSYPLERCYDAGLPAYFDFNNRPFVTHAYANYDYDINIKKMLYIKPKYTFSYNTDAMDWDTAVIRNPALMTMDYHHIHVINTPHGAMAWTARQGSSGTYDLYLFSADSMKWRLLPRTGDAFPSSYGDNGGAFYDTKRDRMVMVYAASGTTAPIVRSYGFATGVVTTHNPSNNVPFGTAGFREAVYLPDLDKGIFMATDQSGRQLFWDCATDMWAPASLAKGTGAANTFHVSSGFMYDPKRNLVWDSETNSETYCLRVTASLFANTESSSDKEAGNAFTAIPNPFNPVTTFELPKPGYQVAVFNISGKCVANLGRLTHRTVQWNASELPSGLYLVKAKLGIHSINKAVTLTK